MPVAATEDGRSQAPQAPVWQQGHQVPPWRAVPVLPSYPAVGTGRCWAASAHPWSRAIGHWAHKGRGGPRSILVPAPRKRVWRELAVGTLQGPSPAAISSVEHGGDFSSGPTALRSPLLSGRHADGGRVHSNRRVAGPTSGQMARPTIYQASGASGPVTLGCKPGNCTQREQPQEEEFTLAHFGGHPRVPRPVGTALGAFPCGRKWGSQGTAWAGHRMTHKPVQTPGSTFSVPCDLAQTSTAARHGGTCL